MDRENEILVSVIMPAYNCTAYIDAAIGSVLQQEVPLELIVVDDCSTDGLAMLMQRYQEDHRIRYVQNEKNMGAAASRNRGVAMAKGKYIAFLDADDIWLPHKLSRQLQKLQETGTVICATARELMTPDGSVSGHIIPVRTEYTYRDLCFHNQLSCSSVVIQTDVAREFPMEHDDAHEDYLMWLKVLQKYKRGCGIDEPLLLYRISSTGKSGSKWHSAKMTYRTYRYMGFGILRASVFFVTYTAHGIRKYLRWFMK